MNVRNAGSLVGVALAVVLVLATLGAPPLAWLLVAAVASLAIGTYIVAEVARAEDTDPAHRVPTPDERAARSAASQGSATGASVDVPAAPDHAGRTLEVTAVRAVGAPRPTTTPSVDVSIVRPAGKGPGKPAVWLHRCGGRRVHRSATEGGWVVQQVTTKDPDDPRKRVIGAPLWLATEAEAIKVADNLARGILPEDVDAAGRFGVPAMATAEARRRKVRLTGAEQARRLASEWGLLAGA